MIPATAHAMGGDVTRLSYDVEPMPTMSEADSKQLLAAHGVPVLDERTVTSADEATQAAKEIGFPVVAKLCGAAIAHKTERGLVRLGLADDAAVRVATNELLAAARPEDGEVAVLLAPMVTGTRELIAGLADDSTFGRTVMLGVGGVLAEAVADVAFRLVPITRADAEDMIDDLATQRLFGPFRGEPAIDRTKLVDVLVGLSDAAVAHPEICGADVNPLIVVDGAPVAVDALVEVQR
jgi:acetyl-CoA synthetase (ADP-forming)